MVHNVFNQRWVTRPEDSFIPCFCVEIFSASVQNCQRRDRMRSKMYLVFVQKTPSFLWGTNVVIIDGDAVDVLLSCGMQVQYQVGKRKRVLHENSVALHVDMFLYTTAPQSPLSDICLTSKCIHMVFRVTTCTLQNIGGICTGWFAFVVFNKT